MNITKIIAIAAFTVSVLFVSSLSAQYAVQFDSVGVHLNGVDADTLYIAFRDKPGKMWRIDTTGGPHLEGAKAGQRVFLPDSAYVILQRSNLFSTADSFKVSYATGHPTNLDTTIIAETYLVGGASSFANVVNDTTYRLLFPRPSTWFRMILNQGNLDSAATYLRAVFIRRENAH